MKPDRMKLYKRCLTPNCIAPYSVIRTKADVQRARQLAVIQKDIARAKMRLDRELARFLGTS